MAFDDVEALCREANQLNSVAKTRKDRERVLELLNEALGIGGQSAVVYSTRAKVYSALSKPEHAIADITKAIRLEPHHPIFVCERATIYCNNGDYNEALEDMDSVIDAFPLAPSYRYQRSEVLFSLKRYKAAIADITFAIDNERKPFKGFLARGRLYTKLGLETEAKSDLAKARKVDELSSEDFSNLGEAYYDLGMYERAQMCFENAIRRKRTHAAYHINLGLTHYHMHRYKEAKQDFSLAIRLEPENAEAFYSRGLVSLSIGAYQVAVTDFDVAVAFQPNSAKYLHALGLAYQNTETSDDSNPDRAKPVELALHCFKTAYLVDNTQTSSLYHAALMHQRIGNLDEAEKAFAKVAAKCPGDPLVKEAQGLLYQQLNQHQLADVAFTAAISLSPSVGSLYYSRGESRHRISQHKLAVKDFNTAIELDFSIPEVFSARAMALRAVGRHREAMLDIARALDESADLPDAELFFNSSLCCEDIGELDTAYEHISTAISIEKENSKLFLQRGIVNRKLNKFEEAITDLYQAVQYLGFEFPESCDILSTIYYNIGLSYFHLRNFELSEEHFSKTISCLCGRVPNVRLPSVNAIITNGPSETTESQGQRISPNLSKSQTSEMFVRYNKCAEGGSTTESKTNVETQQGDTHHIDSNDSIHSLDDNSDSEESVEEKEYDLLSSVVETSAKVKKQEKRAAAGSRNNRSFTSSHSHWCSNTTISLQIQEYLDSGNLDKAHELVTATFERAKARQLVGLHRGSTEDLTVVIDFCAQCANAYFCRGFAYKSLKMYSKAAEDFEKAKELDPGNPSYVVNYRKVYGEGSRLIHTPGTEVVEFTRSASPLQKHK